MQSVIVDSKIAMIDLQNWGFRQKAVNESVPFRCVVECFNVYIFRNKVN